MSVSHPAIKSPSKTNSSSYDDQTDRRTIEDLIDKLFTPAVKEKLQQNSSPNSSKYKQLSMSKFCLRSSQHPKKEVSSTSGTSNQVQTKTVEKPEKKKTARGRSKKETPDKKVSSGRIGKRKKDNSNNTKLTSFRGWLSKHNKPAENNKMAENPKDKVKTKKENAKVLVESSDNNKSPAKKGDRSLKRQSSGSFAKYGIRIPSFQDIVAYQKKFQDQKQCIESVNTEDSQESLEFNIEEPQLPEVVLDCKHLSKQDLKEAFKRNYEYVCGIFHGNQYSARHERFKNQNRKDEFTSKDLKYNISMITFTPKQKQHLLIQLHEKFDNEESLSRNNQYFFKVLLPELCLKIFMDVHNMSYEEATTYLEERPVECEFV